MALEVDTVRVNKQMPKSKKTAEDLTIFVSAKSKPVAGNLVAGIEAEVHRDFETCSALREEWDSFVKTVNGEIFLTYDWCRIWWKHYGKARKLLILVFRCQGELVGILPVFYERIWLGPLLGRVVKIVGTDFTPIALSVPVRHEFVEAVLCSFRMLIDEEWEWDIIRLGSIAGMYKSLSELVSCTQKTFMGSHRVESNEEDVQTYYEIPASWEEYLKTLSGRNRANARKAFRKIEERKVNVVVRRADAKTVGESFDAFVETHQAYWRALGKPGHFGAWPGAYEFHREQAEIQAKSERLRLHEILLDGKCVAHEYDYSYGKSQCWFLYGRSAEAYKSGFGFNWIALRAKFDIAANEGAVWADSMRGAYDYKLETGGKRLPITNVTIVPLKGLRALRVRCFRILARAIDVAYVRIWRRRVAPKIHYRVGSFWKIWIRTHVLAAKKCK